MSNRREFLKDAGVMAGAATVTGYVAAPEAVVAAATRVGMLPEQAVVETPVDPSLPPSGVKAGPLPPVPTPKCTPAALAARGQIAAKVDQRLLTKANRLFGGTAEGRVTEMLQNSRRAGATTVWVLYDQEHKLVRYFDDGHGLTDFGQLLSLGFSGWGDDIEAAEDPAGAGFFSLAPRKVTVHSRGQKVVIDEGGWLGMPIDVVPSDWYGKGVQMEFHDEWPEHIVQSESEFGPLTVYYNGKKLKHRAFIDTSRKFYDCPELGCRIQLRSAHIPGRGRSHYHRNYVNFNFHGQTLSSHEITSELHDHMRYDVAVELTGAPTELRMVLPAREKLVINDAARRLQDKIELCIYDAIAQKGSHKLPYSLYTRGTELGFDLPEADESWIDGVGSWGEHCFENIDFPDRSGNRLRIGMDSDEGKAMDLLAGYARRCNYLPCEPGCGMGGYSWAKRLPRVQELEIVPERYEDKPHLRAFSLNGTDTVICKSIEVKVVYDDGYGQLIEDTFNTDVSYSEADSTLYLTKRGAHNVRYSAVFGITGCNWDDDRSWDAQYADFEEEYNDLLATLKGPCEAVRREAVEVAERLATRALNTVPTECKLWDQVVMAKDGTMQVLYLGNVVAVVAEPKDDDA